MSCSETLTPFGIAFLDPHIWISKRIIFSLPSLQALTTNFLEPPEVRLGLLHFILDLSILAISIDLKTFY